MNKLIISRLPQLIFGLFLCGFGLAFTIEADLGLNSWDVFHDGFSQVINVKIGFAGVITGFILLIGWIPLKQKPFIGTILNILIIGNVIDVVMIFLPSPKLLLIKVFYLVFGTIFFAVGVGVYVGAGLGPGPRDGIMVGISKLGPSIRVTRIAIDFTAFVVGVILGGSYGVGTIIMVLSVGPIVQFSLKKFDKGAIFSL
ncbi:MAG: hypothetical protein O3A48_00350 [Actinomycetota bacterium]|nr:hypothetical protein [Actinomycetota bacterium]MDA3012980.1 hypothetical protein [Actinomycetota bacterium]